MINVEIGQSNEKEHTVSMIITHDGVPIGTIQYDAPYKDRDTNTRLWYGHITINESEKRKGFATEALLQGDSLLAQDHEGDARIFRSKYSFTRYLSHLDEAQILADTTWFNTHTVRFRLKRK